jgi:hypothetical protein
MSRVRCLFILGVSLSLFVGANIAEAISILNTFAIASASDGVDTDSDIYDDPMLPSPFQIDASQGGSSTDGLIELVSAGSQTTLSYGSELVRNGEPAAMSRLVLEVFFKVDVESTYSLAGLLNAINVGADDSGEVLLNVRLSEQSDETVFDHFLISQNTPNEQFVLGSPGGDSLDSSYGSLTGTLYPIDTYKFFVETSITASPQMDLGASALGNVTLTITTAIPEPASVVLFGLVGLGAILRRKFR